MGEEDLDSMDCAVEMLQGLNAGKTPAAIRKKLKASGYTIKQIAEAGEILTKGL